jgi:hypothetical protein
VQGATWRGHWVPGAGAPAVSTTSSPLRACPPNSNLKSRLRSQNLWLRITWTDEQEEGLYIRDVPGNPRPPPSYVGEWPKRVHPRSPLAPVPAWLPASQRQARHAEGAHATWP